MILEPQIPQWQRPKGQYSVERVNIIVQQVFDNNVELACNALSHAEKLLKSVMQHDKQVINEALNEYDIYKLVELIAKIERKGAL